MDPLTQLQLDIQALLQAEEFFAVIPVLARAQGVTSEEIEARLGKRGLVANASGKTGCCVVVMMPICDAPDADARGPGLDVVIPVTVYERPIINRAEGTGIGETAEEIALQALSAVHGRILHPCAIYADKRAAEPLPLEDEKTVAYMCYFRTHFALAGLPKVARPVIKGTAAAVWIETLAGFGLVSGAAIYYTTDGSYPRPGNPTATLYGFVLVDENGVSITDENNEPLEAPATFAVAAGTVVRAAAYATARQGSDVDRKDF